MAEAVTMRDWMARAAEDLAFAIKAREHMLQRGIRAGWRRCPRCGAKVHFRLTPNGHLSAWCDTPGCIRIME